MMSTQQKRYYNQSDSSVVVDDDGRSVDGLSRFEHEPTDQIDGLVGLGMVIDLGDVEPDDEQDVALPYDGYNDTSDDTEQASDENDSTGATLAPQQTSAKTKRKSTTKNKEN